MSLKTPTMKTLITFIIILSSSLAFSQDLTFRSNPERYILGTQKDRTASISLGDIDNDGDMDAILANGRHWAQQNLVFFNNGRGIFTVSQPLDVTLETSYATEMADLDGDGDLDVAVGNDMAPNIFYLNDGLGNFKRGGPFGEKILSDQKPYHCRSGSGW
jgi:hypothetical protein